MKTRNLILLAFVGVAIPLADEIYAFVAQGVFSPKLWIFAIMAVGIVTIWVNPPKKQPARRKS